MAAPWLNGLSHFSFGCNSYKQSGCKGQSQTASPIKHQTPYLDPENIRESGLDFTARLREINPGIPIFVDEDAGKDSRFSSSSSIWEKSMKKS